MKIKNDFDCRAISNGHIYELRNRTGWMTVTNYELPNGLFINLTYADIGEFVNQDMVDDMNYYGIPMMLSGSAEVVLDDGTEYTFIPGNAAFGCPCNKRMKMKVTSRNLVGLNMIYNPGCTIGRVGGDPDLSQVLGTLRDRMGTGMDRTFLVPTEVSVLAQSILIELETNRCRNPDYIGKRASQMIHVVYRMPEVVWQDPPEVRDNEKVDRICNLLTDDFSNPRVMKEVCEAEGVDQFWFINNFRRRYGATPTEHAVRFKHIRAAALLLTGRHTVRDVMEMVGYSSKSMFLKAFRKVHGCNPREYAEGFDAMIEDYTGEAAGDHSI